MPRKETVHGNFTPKPRTSYYQSQDINSLEVTNQMIKVIWDILFEMSLIFLEM